MMTDKTYQQITSRMAEISKKHKLPSTVSQMWTVLFKHQGANMTEEDEAFNEIERKAKQRMESVRVAVHTLTEYQRGYETGFIDGMQKQAQSSVDKAVNAMSQRTEQTSAERTLQSLGYINNGGEYWKPPLGKQPSPQRTWVGLDWLPEHKCGLHLSHNEHRDVYETVEQFYDADDFISTEEWHKAVAEDSVWVLQWYPNTPIGFNRIAASTLEAIEAKLKEKNT